LYCLAIAAFRESMDYPAGINASAKLSTKLANLYQDSSVKPLFDTNVFTYGVTNNVEVGVNLQTAPAIVELPPYAAAAKRKKRIAGAP
jgi:hypothetical protein